MNFCAAILMLKLSNICSIFCVLCFIISGKVNTQLKRKKDLCRVWRRFCDWSNMPEVVCEVSWYHWHFGQISLCRGAVLCIGRCLAAPLASTHRKSIAGDSRHTQNIQINEVIGENEKNCLLFHGKKVTDFFANPINGAANQCLSLPPPPPP